MGQHADIFLSGICNLTYITSTDRCIGLLNLWIQVFSVLLPQEYKSKHPAVLCNSSVVVL